MQSSIIIEFAGLPNAGKTSLIQELERDFNRSKGVKVVTFQEPAEIVPDILEKCSMERNTWTTFEAFQNQLVAKYTDADVVILDRGYYDAILWLEYMDKNKWCTAPYLHATSTLLTKAGDNLKLKPDCLFLFDCSVDESIKRRMQQSDKPVSNSTKEFLTNYKETMQKFSKNFTNRFPDTKLFELNTTDLTPKDMLRITKDKILSYID